VTQEERPAWVVNLLGWSPQARTGRNGLVEKSAAADGGTLGPQGDSAGSRSRSVPRSAGEWVQPKHNRFHPVVRARR